MGGGMEGGTLHPPLCRLVRFIRDPDARLALVSALGGPGCGAGRSSA